ncbi:hypothetical protein GCM10025864_36110 [Luteimicrobium album]|uniref:Uncharacterized protein n=1 Tax=Luteimicrobium album TaxID=1054550 RepID=A0ABQ6I5W2_9MICO|nr:hypothetical protein GCM10025864_36110 [Luteimicrobium album]
MSALAAPVAAHEDFEDGRAPAQRLVRESPNHAVTCKTFPAAAAAPAVGLDNAAREDGTVELKALADHNQAEAVESGEGRQVGVAESSRRGSVKHVEVFQMVSVRTSIFGRPRHLPADRRASPTYTLIWEEPFCTETGVARRGCLFVVPGEEPLDFTGRLGTTRRSSG